MSSLISDLVARSVISELDGVNAIPILWREAGENEVRLSISAGIRFYERPWKFSVPPFPRASASCAVPDTINVKEQTPKATWCRPVASLGGPSFPFGLQLTGYFSSC